MCGYNFFTHHMYSDSFQKQQLALQLLLELKHLQVLNLQG